jgi:RimJ/RimL family protein N-acetyltransferase
VSFVFRPFSRADADAVLLWHYEPPYDEYDPGADPSEVDGILEGVESSTWYAVDDADGSLVGFVDCRPSEADVEIGFGLRPDRTGQGLGPSFVEAIVDLIGTRWDPPLISLDVFPWNERAIRAYEHAGFVRGEVYDRRFDPDVVRTFLRMTRPLR